MSTLSTLKTVARLGLLPIRGETHAQRLEDFYRGQAQDYDAFRRRLLHGRHTLIGALPLDAGDVWCDLGAGTGEVAWDGCDGSGRRVPRGAYFVRVRGDAASVLRRVWVLP